MLLLRFHAGVHQPLWSHSYLGYGFDVVQSKVDTLVKELALRSHQHHGDNSSSTDASSLTALSPPPSVGLSVEAAGTATAAAAGGHSNVPPDHQSESAAAAAAGAQPAPAPSEGSNEQQLGQQQLSPDALVHVAAEGVMDPCLPAGYRSDDGRVGSGVWQACQQLVQAVLDPSACKPQRETPCPEIPDHMPRLTGGAGGTASKEGRCRRQLCCVICGESL